jgi:hypothetical protein
MTVLVQQRGPSDCMLATIAMAAGKCYDDLWTIDDFNKVTLDRGVSDESPWMERAGFVEGVDYARVYCNSENQGVLKSLLRGRRAMISVNSLNIDGGYHILYWDGAKVYDPSSKQTFTYLSSMCIASVIIFLKDAP